MAKTNELVKFYRGSEDIYIARWESNPNDLVGALFFDPTSRHIYFNGVLYGVNISSDLGDYATLDWVDELYGKAFVSISSSNDADGFKVSFISKDGTSEWSFLIPIASSTNNGLMTSDDLNKIDTINSKVTLLLEDLNTTNDTINTIKTKLDTIDEGAEVNAINTIKVDGTTLDIVEEGDTVKAINIELTDKIKEIVGIQVGTVYVYMGSRDTISDLDSISNKATGHVYNITQLFELDDNVYPAGTNVAWDGEKWDALGGIVNLQPIESAITGINTTLESYGNRITSLEESVGGGSGEGSLSGRVSTLEEKIDILLSDINTEGSVEYTSLTIATTIVEDALTWMELE